MGQGLNRLIAQGGTGIASPVQRYQSARKDMQAEQMNNLAMQSTRQGMGINRNVDARAKQAADIKILAPFMKNILQIKDPLEQEQAYQQALPMIQQQGVDISKAPPQWDSNIGSTIMQAGGLELDLVEGNPVNVMYKGSLMNAIDDGTGNYVDERTRQPLYGAVKAPTRQEQGGIGEVTSGTGSTRFKFNDARRIAEDSVIKTVKLNNELTKLIDDPNWVGGTAGDVIGMVNSISQQMSNFSGNPPKDYGQVSPDDISAGSRGQFSKLRKKAMAGDRYSAAKIEAAYANAKRVDPNSKITDKDFDFASKMLGTGGDRESIKQILRDNNKRSISTYNDEETNAKSRNSWYTPSPLGADRQSQLFGISEQPQVAPPIVDVNDPNAEFDVDGWMEQAEKL